jgi:hypothetical protein
MNKHIIKIETGHPGYKNYVILSNVVGIEEIKDGLEKLILNKKGRFSLYKTEPFQIHQNGSLCFEIIGDDEIEKFHKPKYWNVILNRLGCYLLLPMLGFTFY